MANGNGMGGSFGAAIFEAREKSDKVVDLLEALVSRSDNITRAIQEQVNEEQFTWIQQVGIVGAADTDVEIPIPAPFPGSAYLINQIAVTGSANGPCAVYFDSVDLPNLVHFIPNAQIHANYKVEIYVPQNRKLIAHFYTQSANQVCSFNFQARRFTQGV